mgnify:CR=1 FL=1
MKGKFVESNLEPYKVWCPSYVPIPYHKYTWSYCDYTFRGHCSYSFLYSLLSPKQSKGTMLEQLVPEPTFFHFPEKNYTLKQSRRVAGAATTKYSWRNGRTTINGILFIRTFLNIARVGTFSKKFRPEIVETDPIGCLEREVSELGQLFIWSFRSRIWR